MESWESVSILTLCSVIKAVWLWLYAPADGGNYFISLEKVRRAERSRDSQVDKKSQRRRHSSSVETWSSTCNRRDEKSVREQPWLLDCGLRERSETDGEERETREREEEIEKRRPHAAAYVSASLSRDKISGNYSGDASVSQQEGCGASIPSGVFGLITSRP
ncbi:hypothetical protein EYF80_056259 [Liparis tanakae]|uniref:Uncharacterized protein n=1 Tax=Liparis tanakae TaxID=230148 RepID=A0A4Z2EYX8_9TELE|nr:hypothetical protein EYF80_056259 [Liparis tanakae]